ncbi:MAG TPA: hypothetical protein VKU44_09620 [Terriglobia bacterium]|nr:hypothetical protein [Terriglobia bacterium]
MGVATNRRSDACHRVLLAAIALVATACPLGRAQQAAPAGAAGPAGATESQTPAQPELIRAIKRLEKKLGFRRTGNFKTRSDEITAFYRCYYTGKLELPDSYENLRLKQGTKDGCDLDPEQYDVFFYPIEAVASGKSPVTASLERDSMERFLVVVPHEDFHATKELHKLPAALTEAASNLAGFLTAAEVARQKFGPDSAVAQNLDREPDLYLRKSELVNRYHDKLGQLYASVRAGQIGRPEALAEKDRLFVQMQDECQAISPDPKSFNKCLAANNNAGLAFDATYTKYYPLGYELFVAEGRKARATLDAIKEALAVKSESEAVQRLEDLIREAKRSSHP